MDEQAFLDFAASLPDKEIYNAISSAKPLSPCKHCMGLPAAGIPPAVCLTVLRALSCVCSASAAQAQPEFVLHNLSNLWQPALPHALFCRAVCKHAGANNVQRCWDATPPPPGVLAIGDGVQALNPLYGQGMSVAAKSAECLGKVMQASFDGKASLEARRQAVRGMGPAFQKQLAAVVAPAWMMATSEDQRCVRLCAVRCLC
jgi:hypothetical protein